MALVSTLPVEPASVAQSDAGPTGNHEVMGLIPARSCNILFVETDHIFYSNCQLCSSRGLSLPRKIVVR